MAFVEPDIIFRADRTYNDSEEELRLERSEWQGKDVYRLRVVFKTQEGQWRWSQARPSSTQRYWQEFNLKARELRALGELLIAESEAQQQALDPNEPIAEGAPKASGSRRPPPGLDGKQRRAPAPREQRAMAEYDQAQNRNRRVPVSGPDQEDDDIPF
jgi:hypothetical protein